MVPCEVSTVSDDLGALLSAGVGSLCFSKSKVNTFESEQFMLTSPIKLYGDADLILEQELAHCQKYQYLV